MTNQDLIDWVNAGQSRTALEKAWKELKMLGAMPRALTDVDVQLVAYLETLSPNDRADWSPTATPTPAAGTGRKFTIPTTIPTWGVVLGVGLAAGVVVFTMAEFALWWWLYAPIMGGIAAFTTWRIASDWRLALTAFIGGVLLSLALGELGFWWLPYPAIAAAAGFAAYLGRK